MNILISELIKLKQNFKDKKRCRFFVFTVYFLFALLLSGAFYIGKKFNIPYEKITGDPASTFNSNPFVGFISNIGAFVWCITASVCFFTSFLLSAIDKKKALFFMCSGIFTSILLVDDFFMFHDYVFYSLNRFEITQPIIFIIQPIIYAVYTIFLIWYVIKFLKIILNSSYIFLILAIGFLGLSVLTDLISEYSDLENFNSNLEYFLEDSFKFIGIINWMLFFSIAAHNTLFYKLKRNGLIDFE